MRKLQILVCAQKSDYRIRTEYPYTPIQTGKSLHPDVDLGFLTDNIGDNISKKNNKFCEWCAHYWAWKNLHDVKYIGLCHYRRYFDIDLSESNIEKILSKHDAIIIKQESVMVSRRQRELDLVRMTSLEDVYVFFDTFLMIHPEYEKQLIEYFYNSKDSVPYSMIIASKQVHDKICEFIFPVLLEFEKKIKSHGYSRENRAVAYIGEYILGLALFCMNLSTYRVPLCFIEDDGTVRKKKWGERIKSNLKYAIEQFGCWIINLAYPVPSSIVCPPEVRVGLKNDGIIIEKLK